MKERIDFGDVGLKISDEIHFVNNPHLSFFVASGNGTPGNGGTLVKYKDGRIGSFSLRLITRRLLGDQFSPEQDIFSLWSFQGKTLRAMYLDKKKIE